MSSQSLNSVSTVRCLSNLTRCRRRLTFADTLEALQLYSGTGSTRNAVFDISLPVSQTMAVLVPGIEESIVMPRSAQAHVSSIHHASIVVLSLITAVHQYLHSRKDMTASSLTWPLDSCNRLCSTLLAIGRNNPTTAPFPALQKLLEASTSMIKTRNRPSISRPDASLICQQLALVLRFQQQLKNTSMHRPVAFYLLAVSDETKEHYDLCNTFEEIVLPVIGQLLKGDTLRSLHKDLQVCGTHWLQSLQC